MNKTMHISTSVARIVAETIDTLDKKISDLCTEIKEYIKSIKPEVLDAKTEIEIVSKK